MPSLELIVILARRSDVDQGKTDFIAPASTRRPWPPLHVSLASRTEARADPRGSRTNQGPIGGGKRTPTQPDTSRNRPAGAPLRPPVIDGIEEHDPAGRIEQLAQDSDLDRALRIEELRDFPTRRPLRTQIMPTLNPHFPYQPCRACRNQQRNYPM